MKIYTKKGDEGDTDLIKKRVKKNDIKIHIVGELDELQAKLALAIYYLEDENIKKDLSLIDSILFKIATITIDIENVFNFSLSEKEIYFLETKINEMETKIDKLTNFITYEGSLPSIKITLAKTQVRKVERLMVEDNTDKFVLKFINRLSDYLFVLARYINKEKGYKEKLRMTDYKL